MTLYVFANYINISQNYDVGMTLKLESESRDHAFSMQFEYFQKHNFLNGFIIKRSPNTVFWRFDQSKLQNQPVFSVHK